MNKSEAEFAEYMQELVTDVIETIGGEPAANVAAACAAVIVFMMPRMSKNEREQITLVLQDMVQTVGKGKGGHIKEFKH